MVVLVFPVADDDLGLQQRVEASDVQTVLTQTRIE